MEVRTCPSVSMTMYRPSRVLGTFAIYLFLAGWGTAVGGQTAQESVINPYARDPDAIEQGRAFFRLGCALCHGVDARGTFRGPDLTEGRWIHGASDAAVFRNVSNGIPGTQMPVSFFSTAENWMIISYVRSLGAADRPPLEGDTRVGEYIFFEDSDCSQCHMIRGRGGRLGPDLSRIGASRSPEKLVEAIRRPSENINERFDHVIVRTRAGGRFEGVIKNEDTFSIQLMTYGEEMRFFFKDELEEVTYRTESVMPTYDRRSLDDEGLRDLVAFLDSQRGR